MSCDRSSKLREAKKLLEEYQRRRHDVAEAAAGSDGGFVHDALLSPFVPVKGGRAGHAEQAFADRSIERSRRESTHEQASSGTDVDNYSQVLSVLVNDKAGLQSQLRQTVDLANALNAEKTQLLADYAALSERNAIDRTEAEKLRSENERLRRQLEEETQRAKAHHAEVARLSRLLEEANEDSEEIRGRLRSCEQELSALIGQLNANSPSTDRSAPESQMDVAQLEADLNRARNEASYMRSMYEMASAHMAKLADDWQNERSRFEEEKDHLLSELAACNLHKQEQQSPPQAGVEENNSNAAQNDLIASLRRELEEKSVRIDALQAAGQEKDEQIRTLSENLSSSADRMVNYQLVLDDLHNERAVSSRALQQNKLIKEQLAELERKLIEVTADNANLASMLPQLDANHETRASSDRHESNNTDEAPLAASSNTTGGNEQDTSDESLPSPFTELLQQRFVKAMNENAELVDENQRLEHLIIQLQNETDIIGEFITLYQHQRKVINDRLKEKEEYTAHVCREKERMKDNVMELRSLITKLFIEMGLLKSLVRNGSDYASEGEAVSNGDGDYRIVMANGCASMSDDEPCTVDSQSSDSMYLLVERINYLLRELLQPELANQLPPIGMQLHCDHCTGKLMML